MYVYSAEGIRVKKKGKVKLELKLDRYKDRKKEDGGKRPKGWRFRKILKRGKYLGGGGVRQKKTK